MRLRMTMNQGKKWKKANKSENVQERKNRRKEKKNMYKQTKAIKIYRSRKEVV